MDVNLTPGSSLLNNSQSLGGTPPAANPFASIQPQSSLGQTNPFSGGVSTATSGTQPFAPDASTGNIVEQTILTLIAPGFAAEQPNRLNTPAGSSAQSLLIYFGGSGIPTVVSGELQFGMVVDEIPCLYDDDVSTPLPVGKYDPGDPFGYNLASVTVSKPSDGYSSFGLITNNGYAGEPLYQLENTPDSFDPRFSTQTGTADLLFASDGTVAFTYEQDAILSRYNGELVVGQAFYSSVGVVIRNAQTPYNILGAVTLGNFLVSSGEGGVPRLRGMISAFDYVGNKSVSKDVTPFSSALQRYSITLDGDNLVVHLDGAVLYTTSFSVSFTGEYMVQLEAQTTGASISLSSVFPPYLGIGTGRFTDDALFDSGGYTVGSLLG